MSNSSNGASGGVSVLGLLGVAFVVLKLVGIIDWSWWWVTAPFWGGLAIGAVILLWFVLAWLVMLASVHYVAWWAKRRARRAKEKA